jgi:hypothetical protein
MLKIVTMVGPHNKFCETDIVHKIIVVEMGYSETTYRILN